jgi:hypothetical protein
MSNTPTPTIVAPIWPADWSQFVPDTLSALFIGVLVGVVLFRWQRSIETRAEERIALSSWKLARTSFAVAMSKAWNPTAGARILDEITKQTIGLRELGRSSDVAVWADAVPKNVELRTITTLLRDLDRLEVTAAELYSLITVTACFDKIRHEVSQQVVGTACTLAIGGYDPANIFSSHIEPFVPLAQEVIDDETVVDRVSEFRELHGRVRTNYTDLRALLRVD